MINSKFLLKMRNMFLERIVRRWVQFFRYKFFKNFQVSLGVRIHNLLRSILSVHHSFFFFFSTFFKENFPQNFFLLFVRIIVLDVVIVRLIKYKIVVVIAIRILISDSAECVTIASIHNLLALLTCR